MISREKTLFSFAWVLIEKFGFSLLSFISTLFLARLLTPYDFGIIGTVSIFIAISDMIVEAGFGAALVQKKNISDKDFSTVFIFNSLMSVTIYALLFIAAPYVAEYFSNSLYTSVIRVLGLKLLINSVTLTQRVHIIRALEFKKQSFINITSLFFSVLLAISFAYMGYGVWALVIQVVSYSFFVSFLMFLSVRFIPTLIFSKDSFKELFSFGGKIIINSVLETAYNDVFGIIITKKYSATLTGFYTQANKLVSFPNNLFFSLYDSAGFPILSRIDNDDDFKHNLSIINKGIFSIALPLLLIIPFQSANIVTVVLGVKWIESAPILTILSISLLSSLISKFSISVLKAKGKGEEILRYGIIKIAIGVIILLITIMIDFHAIMYGIVLTNILFSLIVFHSITKITLYKWIDLFNDYVVLLLVFCFINSFIFMIIRFLNFSDVYMEFSIYLLLMFVFSAFYFFTFQRNMLQKVIAIVKRKK